MRSSEAPVFPDGPEEAPANTPADQRHMREAAETSNKTA